MAKDIDSIERSVLTPTQNVASGNSFDRLSEATTGLAKIVSNKLNEAQVDMASKQGEQDALSGEAPKKLAPGFNKVTRAYNNAVSNTEARHQVIAAGEQIREAYAHATDPANFNENSPALFKANLQGIVDGTLENTRESNKPKVALALEKLSADASAQMLNHSIEFDNKQTIKNMSADVDMMMRQRRNAAIEGNQGNVTAFDEMLNETLEDYANQNAVIKNTLPELKKKLDQNKQVDNILGGFSQAASEGKQAEFLSDLSHNKQGLDFDTWQQATKEVLALDATEQNLNYQARAIEKQTIVNGIDDGTITTQDQIAENDNLTPVDVLQLQDQLVKHNQAIAKKQYKILDAQKNIVQGNPGFNAAQQKNDMLATARENFQQLTGNPMTLTDMWDSINGLGPTPASGIPGVSMGSNVPQFDAQLSNQLTSRDPNQVIQAASIYNDAVNVKKQPNLVNLSKEALAIATHFNTLNLGNVDPEVLADRVSTTTLDAKDPEIKTRSERFNALYGSSVNGLKALQSKYKEVFGTDYQPGVDDAAMGVFKETFREQYLMSASEEAALAATKQELRAWGTSKYFEDGMVAQPVPEKELAVANIGNAFDNQFRVTAQLIINENKAELEANAKLPENQRNLKPFKIEWSEPKSQSINLDKITEQDKVYKPLGKEITASTTLADMFFAGDKPKVKINGQETELFLMPTPESRLGDRVQYALYYHDKLGMAQPLPDVNSPTGVAMFSPVGMQEWAPNIFNQQQDTKIKDAAKRFKREQVMQDWDALKPQNVWQSLAQIESLIFGSSTEKFMRGTPAERAEIFRRIQSNDTDDIQSFIRQRIQGPNAAAQPAEAKKADNVGIDADQSPADRLGKAAKKPAKKKRAK